MTTQENKAVSNKVAEAIGRADLLLREYYPDFSIIPNG